MPTFDQMPLQEALLKTATGKSAQITKEYLGYIEQLPEDQAGRLQPDEGESVATIRRRLGVAAKLSVKDIIIKRQGNEVYFWEEPYPRLRRQIRRSQSISEVGMVNQPTPLKEATYVGTQHHNQSHHP